MEKSDTPTPQELARQANAIADELEATASTVAVTIQHLAYTCLRQCAAALKRLARMEQDLKSLFDEGARAKAELIDARTTLARVEQERDASDAVVAVSRFLSDVDGPERVRLMKWRDEAKERHRAKQKTGGER